MAVVVVGLVPFGMGSAEAATTPLHQPVAMVAPYEYMGWGNPPPPASVLAATGIHDFTLAFILSNGTCDPEWDGSRPLLGGTDAATIAAIRAAGGNVDVSFGGADGTKLGVVCPNATALMGAYQTVISAYDLSAIDVDIEGIEYASAAARSRVIIALAALQRRDPHLEISITFQVYRSGLGADGKSMIRHAAALQFQPYAWTIMTFDLQPAVSNMAAATERLTGDLAQVMAKAYRESSAQAYAHMGISSMNGDTDIGGETVSVSAFGQILAFAEQKHLARVSFWAVNRDRPCTEGFAAGDGNCSGISQTPYAFTDLLASYHS
ncbi:MAG TPA: chitinase [Acidimicrobiales bacterium]